MTPPPLSPPTLPVPAPDSAPPGAVFELQAHPSHRGKAASAGLALAIVACFLATGCLKFRPVSDPTRFFVLTPIPQNAPDPKPQPKTAPIHLGLSNIRLPNYLNVDSLAVRSNANEIVYLLDAQWAERLDRSFQRVLAFNLRRVLSPDSIFIGDWRTSVVTHELLLAVSRFEPDASGTVTLEATWRIAAPGGAKVLRVVEASIQVSGPPPTADPHGTVAAMSQALAELAQRIAASF